LTLAKVMKFVTYDSIFDGSLDGRTFSGFKMALERLAKSKKVNKSLDAVYNGLNMFYKKICNCYELVRVLKAGNRSDVVKAIGAVVKDKIQLSDPIREDIFRFEADHSATQREWKHVFTLLVPMGTAREFNPATPLLCTLRKPIEKKVELFEDLLASLVLVPLLGEGLCQRDTVLSICAMCNEQFAQLDLISCGDALGALRTRVVIVTSVLGAVANLSVDPALVVAQLRLVFVCACSVCLEAFGFRGARMTICEQARAYIHACMCFGALRC
jgi:hypothetical protein